MAAQQVLTGCEKLAKRDQYAEIIALAVDKGAAADAIEKLVNLQQQVLAKEYEQDFNDAMNRAQTEMKHVRADAENPQTKSKYATYKALDSALRPIYTKFGFSLSFSTTDCPIPEHIRVLCFVSCSGHTRTYQCDMPCDGKGAKGGDVMTKTHAAGAAMSYGMRYLLKMIFNIAVGEDDTDGNEPQAEWVENFLEAIRGAGDYDELDRYFREAFKKTNGDTKIQKILVAAKDRRRGELRNANHQL